jgi:AraC family transcriptional regulator of adaptative response / DNA-3-methyladenine glycosylase II
MLGFLAARAIPGVELVRAGSYSRTFELAGAQGALAVTAVPGRNHLLATIHTDDSSASVTIGARLRRVFDLDADSNAIDARLATDPRLAARVRARPGVRVPGAWDSFELAVRAVLGQQISVAAATTFAARIAERFGTPLPAALSAIVEARSASHERKVDGLRLVFPTPQLLAGADLAGIGLTRARAQTLRALASAASLDPQLFSPCPTLDQSVSKLTALPGIGPWTAQYIALRALHEADAFPASDLGLMRALETARGRPTAAELLRQAEAWRPWRAYAVLRLWTQPSDREPPAS